MMQSHAGCELPVSEHRVFILVDQEKRTPASHCIAGCQNVSPILALQSVLMLSSLLRQQADSGAAWAICELVPAVLCSAMLRSATLCSASALKIQIAAGDISAGRHAGHQHVLSAYPLQRQ